MGGADRVLFDVTPRSFPDITYSSGVTLDYTYSLIRPNAPPPTAVETGSGADFIRITGSVYSANAGNGDDVIELAPQARGSMVGDLGCDVPRLSGFRAAYQIGASGALAIRGSELYVEARQFERFEFLDGAWTPERFCAAT